MGREKTLLERIAACGPRADAQLRGASAVEDIRALEESVRQHLVRLLNSRHGMSEAMQDYGLPALADMTVGTGDHVRLIQEAIRVAVEKYEPRLRRVRVLRNPDEEGPQKLVFRVEGELQTRSERYLVSYQAAVAGNGRFDVQE